MNSKERGYMSDDGRIMKAGLIIAVLIIVVRILLEQVGAPLMVNMIFGVVWLYFVLPVLFALAIRVRGYARPYGILLKDVVLFAVFTRVMVMVTYMLAYYFKWTAPRFAANEGGTVGGNVSISQGLFLIPTRNALIWILMATVVGMIIGSITLLLKHKKPTPASAA